MIIAQYSDQVVPENQAIDERLFDRVGHRDVLIGYIASCPDPARFYFDDRCDYYAQYGAEVTKYIDLEDGFSLETLAEVFKCDLVHLSGGNTARFMYWAERRQLGFQLSAYLAHGGAVVGASAGAIILTPSIRLAVEDGEHYEQLNSNGGLGIVTWDFYPHAKDTPDLKTRLIRYAALSGRDVYMCGDGGGLIFDGNDVELIGSVKRVTGSKESPQ